MSAREELGAKSVSVKSPKGKHPAVKFKSYFNSKAYVIFFNGITDNPCNEQWYKNKSTNGTVLYQRILEANINFL